MINKRIMQRYKVRSSELPRGGYVVVVPPTGLRPDATNRGQTTKTWFGGIFTAFEER